MHMCIDEHVCVIMFSTKLEISNSKKKKSNQKSFSPNVLHLHTMQISQIIGKNYLLGFCFRARSRHKHIYHQNYPSDTIAFKICIYQIAEQLIMSSTCNPSSFS